MTKCAIVGSLVTFCIGLLIIGYFIDIASYPVLKRIGESALQELKSSRKQGEGNAWDYYVQVVEKMEGYSVNKDLASYSYGSIKITKEIEKEINAHREIIEIIEIGTKQPFCSIPLEYEKGWEKPILRYNELKHISTLFVAQALHELEKGKTEDGLSYIFCGLTFTNHIMGGAPNQLSYIIGMGLMNHYLRTLEISLSTGIFNKQQLQKINLFLNKLEKDLPMFSWVSEGELNIDKIGMSSIPFFKPIELNLPHLYKLMAYISSGKPKKTENSEETKKPPYHYDEAIKIRILCWRYLFSTRLAAIRSFKFRKKQLSSIDRIEKTFLEKPKNEFKILKPIEKLEIEKADSRNPVLGVFPFYTSFLERKLKTVAKIRLLNLSTLIWVFYLENNQFPDSLKDITNDIIIDPYSCDLWEYTHAKDSVVISSPGYNLSFGDDDDLSITLNKSSLENYLMKVHIREK